MPTPALPVETGASPTAWLAAARRARGFIHRVRFDDRRRRLRVVPTQRHDPRCVREIRSTIVLGKTLSEVRTGHDAQTAPHARRRRIHAGVAAHGGGRPARNDGERASDERKQYPYPGRHGGDPLTGGWDLHEPGWALLVRRPGQPRERADGAPRCAPHRAYAYHRVSDVLPAAGHT